MKWKKKNSFNTIEPFLLNFSTSFKWFKSVYLSFGINCFSICISTLIQPFVMNAIFSTINICWILFCEVVMWSLIPFQKIDTQRALRESLHSRHNNINKHEYNMKIKRQCCTISNCMDSYTTYECISTCCALIFQYCFSFHRHIRNDNDSFQSVRIFYTYMTYMNGFNAMTDFIRWSFYYDSFIQNVAIKK